MRTCRFGYPSHRTAGVAGRDALWITVLASNGRWNTAPIRTPRNKRNGTMRLKDKIAIVVGAGQGPGTGMGNGRATVIRFAQEGAKVLSVDEDLKSAEETVAMATKEAAGGGAGEALESDFTREP